MARVFISYRREKLEEVSDLVESIEASHVVWFDQRNELSQPWWQTILDEIRQCDVLVAVFDPDYESSWYCMQELAYADLLGKTLIPVILPDVDAEPRLPKIIDRYSRIRYEPGTRQSQTDILTQLKSASTAQLPAPLPDPPAFADEGVPQLWDRLYRFSETDSESEIIFTLNAMKRRGCNTTQLDVLVNEFCKKPISYEVGAQARDLQKSVPVNPISARPSLPDQNPFEQSGKRATEVESASEKSGPAITSGWISILFVVVSFSIGGWWLNIRSGDTQNVPSQKQIVQSKSPPSIPFPTMIDLPGGNFQMGSENGDDDERPVRQVTVNPFSIGETEITFEQYDAYIEHSGGGVLPSDEEWGRADRPVINISWREAKGYSAWLGERLDGKYKHCGLPTEAEWEYAARAGTVSKYHWGDDDAMAGDYAVFDVESTKVVGSKAPNEFGLFDMAGNVWEWTQDCYQESYINAPVNRSEAVNGVCDSRSLRGGSFLNSRQHLRAASRFVFRPGGMGPDIGFRVVCRPD